MSPASASSEKALGTAEATGGLAVALEEDARLTASLGRTRARYAVPVAERAKELFGDDGAGAAADWIQSDGGGTVQAVPCN